MTETRLRIGALDIETAPNLGYWFGGLYNINMGHTQVKEWGRIICFSAQYEGSKTVIFKSEYHDGRQEMLQALWDFLNSVDVLITYNGDGFDIPWIEGELALAGFVEPEPTYSIDLYKHFKKRSRFASKKLDVMSKRFLGEHKLTHSGFQLWYDCVDPDVDPEVKRKAWNLMRRYAKKDTALLFPLFDEVKGWVKTPVPLVIHDDGAVRCRCGSDNLQWRGTARTQAMSYRRFQCNDCGKWGHSTAKDDKHSNGPGRQS